MNDELNLQESERFLQILYGISEDSVVIATLPALNTIWAKAKETDMIKTFIQSANNQQKNIHFGVGLQDEEGARNDWIQKHNDKDFKYARGNKNTVIGLPGFWLDIDVNGPNHAETDLPENDEDVREIINFFPLSPSIIVSTGGGLHVYWLFKGLWAFKDEVDKENAEKISKNFQNYFRKRASERGWNIDKTSDLARMLRLPGTINWKQKDNPQLVKMLECNEDRRYDVQQFIDIVGLNPDEYGAGNEANRQTIEYEPNTSDIEKIVQGCSWVKHTRDDSQELSEPEWHAMLSIVGNCKDGLKVAHEWSSAYSRYSFEETETKLQHALEDSGPRTCDNISELTNDHYCSSCRFKGKIRSPIVLGLEKNEKPLNMEEAIEEARNVINSVGDGDFGAHLKKEAIAAFALLQKYNPSEFARFKQELKNKNVSFSEFNRLVKAEGKKLETFKRRNSEALALAESISEEGESFSIMIPQGYAVKRNGIYKVFQNEDDVREIQISYNPILITGRFKDIDEGKELVQVSWEKNEMKFSALIDREFIADSRKLISLAAEGFPVHSGNSSELVTYLAALEALNLPHLPTSFTSSHLGWQGRKCEEGFLLNDTLINNDDSETSGAMQSITFNPISPGEKQAVSGFHQRGSFEEWKKEILKIRDYPRILLIFYAAFVPVLLDPLSASNFVIELANRTSTGKTSSLRVAASVWGNSDERASDSIIWSWDVTKVWLERISSILNGIPLMLDDTKRAKYSNMVAEMIYSISNGKGRGRGNLKGISNTKSWRTIMISTAETPSIYLTKDGGTRGRVLEVTGMPFGKTNEHTRQIVTEINMGIKSNFGFAGPMFVKYVMENRNQWPEWKEQLHKKIAEYSKRAKSEVSGRLAEYAALIEFTKNHVDKVLELPFLFENPINVLWDEIVNESKDATGEREALNYVLSWAVSKAESFEGRHVVKDGEIRIPSYGWAGKWNQSEHWKEIAFLPSALKDILTKSGYDPEAILRGWKELKWIDVHEKSSHKYAKQLRFFDHPTWMIVIKRDAVDAHESNAPLLGEEADSLLNRILGK